GEVVVQRGRPDAEFAGQPPGRQGVEAFAVHDRGGDVHDALSGQDRLTRSGHPDSVLPSKGVDRLRYQETNTGSLVDGPGERWRPASVPAPRGTGAAPGPGAVPARAGGPVRPVLDGAAVRPAGRGQRTVGSVRLAGDPVGRTLRLHAGRTATRLLRPGALVHTGHRPAGDAILDAAMVAEPTFGCRFTDGPHTAFVGAACR